ncbi:P-loop NTPase fold protein [Alkalibacterium sp. f15]|uniref:P-loop NTPase fold protein n=1 Tax=Alkalibacterium sp. f15 TaxID=3414029 RepID=UPI003BF83131
MVYQTNESQKEFLELTEINTETAAKHFAKLLEKDKTYFLNGRWGSGKTEFLINTKQHSKKRFTFLDLWRIQDERSVVTIAFTKLMPTTYWGIRLITVLSVIISILMTGVLDLGLSHYTSTLGAQIAGGIALFVSVSSFFKVKSDTFYIQVLKKFPFKKRLLVIDDFDRIDSIRQEQIYVLFNLLENRIPIIFVGDYDKLARSDSKFLQKIINQKIELPYNLHPKNIWEKYFNELENKLKTTIPDKLQKMIIGEQRNLREREQFNDYINHEFFDRRKLDYVQPNQQLLVIYVYLFYPHYYNILINDLPFEFENQLEEEDKSVTDSSPDELLRSLLYDMQRKNYDGYPYAFIKNKEGYFLYEQPSNFTIQELESLIEKDSTLKTYLLSNMDTDFYQYLQTHYRNFSREKKDCILCIALELVKQYKESSTIRFILNEKNEEIMPRKQYIDNYRWGIPEKRVNKTEYQIHEEIYQSWHCLLEKQGFDFSQELYLLEKYSELHFHALGVLFPDIKITSTDSLYWDRKDVALSVYISSQDTWMKFNNWSETTWEAVANLPDKQYLSFWTAQGILDNKKLFDFDSIPEEKKYTVWVSKRDFEHPDKLINYQFVVNKIKPRLKTLEEKGYTFVKSTKK